MKITILCVGKIKEAFYRDAIAEYSKRLQKYVKLQLFEVSDEKVLETQSEAMDEIVLRKEGERLLKHIKDNDYVITLAITGTSLDSVSFSEKIEQLGCHQVSSIVFVIGGSLGLSKEIYDRSDEQISFSKMTFPHQLMRVILLEQVYRAYRIMKKEPYHK